MADITMCAGDRGEVVCPLRGGCFRYEAKPNPFSQSYFLEAPFKQDEEALKPTMVCEHRIEVKNGI